MNIYLPCSHLTPDSSTNPFSSTLDTGAESLLLTSLFPKYLSPGCLQHSPNHHACFSLHDLHPSLNTAASRTLSECSSEEVRPLLRSPRVCLTSAGIKARSSHHRLQATAQLPRGSPSGPLKAPAHPCSRLCAQQRPTVSNALPGTSARAPLLPLRHHSDVTVMKPSLIISLQQPDSALPTPVAALFFSVNTQHLVPYFRAYLLASSLTSKMKAFLFLKIFWLCHTAREIS